MFVILVTYKKTLEIIDQYLIAHREYLAECYQHNQLMVSGPQKPRTGGVIISQLTDKTALEELIKHDPFYIHDLADYQIIEFEPVKYHPGFASFVS